MIIRTYHLGVGTVVKCYFDSEGKLLWLASFPDYGRAYVSARHLVSLDNLITSNN